MIPLGCTWALCNADVQTKHKPCCQCYKNGMQNGYAHHGPVWEVCFDDVFEARMAWRSAPTTIFVLNWTDVYELISLESGCEIGCRSTSSFRAAVTLE